MIVYRVPGGMYMAVFTVAQLQKMTNVSMADLKTGTGDMVFVTRDLGSCVAVAIKDANKKTGGLIHIMLPSHTSGAAVQEFNPARYADTGIDEMIRQLVRLGADKNNLTAKIAGAAHMVRVSDVPESEDISSRNLRAVRNMLKKHNIPIIAADVEDYYPRTVVFELETGVLKIITSQNRERSI